MAPRATTATTATTGTTRTRRTKAEVQREFEAISEDVEKAQESESPKTEESARLREGEVKKAVEGLSVDGVVQDMARLRLDMTRALGELSEKLVQEVNRLSSVREAVALESRELDKLHKIDVAATALDQMVRDHKEQSVELEAEIAEKRAQWAQEAAERDRERKEQEQLLSKGRQREAEEHEYKKSLERKKDKDRYDEECRLRDSQNREKQEALEKSWQHREGSLKEREEELGRLKKESEEFGGRLDREIKKAVADTRAAAQKEGEQQLLFLKKDNEAEKRMAELQIHTLQETAAKQGALVESLQRQLEEAKKQVQDIAIKAIEGASGSRALSHVNQIAMEQAKTRAPA